MKFSIIKNVLLFGFTSGFLVACGSGGVGDNGFDDPVREAESSAGDLDLSRYVALGDSLSAGFADGALYVNGQIDSFPNIMAQSFAEAGGGDFTQPLTADDLGGLLLGGNPLPGFETRLVLAETGNPASPLAPVRQAGTPTTDLANPAAPMPSNMGVPGAKSFHLTAAGYGDLAGVTATPATANPFFVRFASSAGTSILADAAGQAPSFFTLWIGGNDILGYATSGGVGADSTTTPAYGIAGGDITDPVNVFSPSFNGVVATLTAGGTNNVRGALLNIPTITSIPFFTTVPYNAIPLDQTNADASNAAYAAYNAGLAGAVAGSLLSQMEADRRAISFAPGQNAVVIIDESLTDLSGISLPSLRQATAADFILLPLSATLGTLRIAGDPTSVIGVGSPLLDGEVLTDTEALEVETARVSYNTIIQTAADANPNLIYVDVAALLADVADSDGFNYGTETITAVFATGGTFSLDGVHPTAKGYAVVANLVIDSLNTAFNASIPRVDPSVYTETFFEFPAGFDFTQ
jgi:lysophospholipase L1-like esterase